MGVRLEHEAGVGERPVAELVGHDDERHLLRLQLLRQLDATGRIGGCIDQHHEAMAGVRQDDLAKRAGGVLDEDDVGPRPEESACEIQRQPLR